jgi:Transcriptional regulators
MASIRDVARKAGVSPTTVSRTFRTPDLLTADTQHRVLDAARQLGYRPRETASDTGQQRRPASRLSPDNSIGFLFFANLPQQLSSPHLFYAPVLAGAQKEAAERGLHLLVHTTDMTESDAPPPLMAVERVVNGMLLVGAVESQIVDKFAQHVPHVVLVDNRDERGIYESVISDGFGGGLAATRYLLERGHRRISFVSARGGVSTFQDRLRGYWCALMEAGIVPDPSLAILTDSSEEDDFPTAVGRWIERQKAGDPPTAVVAANDSIAVHLLRTLRKEGVRVPEDVSIVGFDDLPLATASDPPLTTVHVDREAMGRLAVQRLGVLMSQETPDEKATLPMGQYTLPVRLIVRGSCRDISR